MVKDCHDYGVGKKKTTLMLDERTYARARKLAAEQGASMSLTTFGDPSARPLSGAAINYRHLDAELEAQYLLGKLGK
jgi:hypothetical protein